MQGISLVAVGRVALAPDLSIFSKFAGRWCCLCMKSMHIITSMVCILSDASVCNHYWLLSILHKLHIYWSHIVSNHMNIKMCHTCEWNFEPQNNVPPIYTRCSVKKFSRLVSSWQAQSNSKVATSAQWENLGGDHTIWFQSIFFPSKPLKYLK